MIEKLTMNPGGKFLLRDLKQHYPSAITLLVLIILTACQADNVQENHPLQGEEDRRHSRVVEADQPGSPLSVSGEEDGYLRVVGTGVNLGEARKDAMRAALQYSVEQLVIVDRVVVGSSLDKDIVLSTMTGFVTEFQVLSTEVKKENLVTVSARVKVDDSRIENYIKGYSAIFNGGLSSSVQGEEIYKRLEALELLEEQRASARKITQRIFESAWGYFPVGFIEVNVSEINVIGTDSIEIVFKWHVTESFYRRIKQHVNEADRIAKAVKLNSQNNYNKKKGRICFAYVPPWYSPSRIDLLFEKKWCSYSAFDFQDLVARWPISIAIIGEDEQGYVSGCFIKKAGLSNLYSNHPPAEHAVAHFLSGHVVLQSPKYVYRSSYTIPANVFYDTNVGKTTESFRVVPISKTMSCAEAIKEYF